MGRLRTRHLLGGLLLATAAALAAGCARARVQNVQADRTAAVPRPGRIVVFDFDTGAADVRVGTSPEGLPLNVQVAAHPWREDVALALVRHLEQTFGGWKKPSAV